MTSTALKLGTYVLLSRPGSDAKTVHGEEIGLLTGILYLAPSDVSGVMNVCAYASTGCRGACLFTAGKGGMDTVREARIRRTVLFAQERPEFWARLVRDIQLLIIDAERNKLVPCVRLNGTADIPWERIRVRFGTVNARNIMELFPSVVFYDYTAYPYAKRPTESLPANYSLTFSRKETTTDEQIANELAHGRNVAIPFATVNSRDKVTGEHLHALPAEFMGTPVINGDLNDARFADPVGVVVGLRAKGDARKDTSGFVVHA
jgi:hypothetical protein